ncbi:MULTISPECIES: DedA family protein [unclassified Pseudoclavibacter]|uniref:DedA family protein n=1 Tax=unclassified Pseudoclavibacter TaxID=2615177 RepID=UPI001BA6D7FA|nr:VTT domain-containing protein [Pseudoclavibacter sp. Marseille-Q4354]MBS3179030.1 VTT domain-containing protein [Pseudoclavibacter sp. Marseille-Q4354]
MEELSEWVLGLRGSGWSFAVAALVLLIGGVVTFLPSQSLVVALSALTAGDQGWTALINLFGLFVFCVAGMVLGDLGTYWLARGIGFGKWSWMNGRRLTAVRTRVGDQLKTRPKWVMVTVRLLPMGRIATVLAASDARMPMPRFLPLSVLASAVWVGYAVLIGAAFGSWSQSNPLLMMALAVVTAIALGVLAQLVNGWFEKLAERRKAHHVAS